MVAVVVVVVVFLAWGLFSFCFGVVLFCFEEGEGRYICCGGFVGFFHFSFLFVVSGEVAGGVGSCFCVFVFVGFFFFFLEDGREGVDYSYDSTKNSTERRLATSPSIEAVHPHARVRAYVSACTSVCACVCARASARVSVRVHEGGRAWSRARV